MKARAEFDEQRRGLCEQHVGEASAVLPNDHLGFAEQLYLNDSE
jgi:hypothetical protein